MEKINGAHGGEPKIRWFCTPTANGGFELVVIDEACGEYLGRMDVRLMNPAYLPMLHQALGAVVQQQQAAAIAANQAEFERLSKMPKV